MRKVLSYNIITAFLILASFVVLVSTSWNICLPDGCSFSAPICSDNSCVSETVDQHIQERSQFLNATVKTNGTASLIIALFFSLFLFGYFKNKITLSDRNSSDQKFLINSPPNSFNLLVILFSDGILNPKIY